MNQDVIFNDQDEGQEQHIREDETWKPTHPLYEDKMIWDGRNGGLQQ